jgi:hypothetical protein
MIRLKDFQCVSCGEIFEKLLIVEENTTVKHCGVPSKSVYISAPGVHYRPHFSHGLNREVSSYKEEERALTKEKNGAWIASKNEANGIYDTDHFDGPVAIRNARKEEIKRSVEKAADKLTRDGQIQLNY